MAGGLVSLASVAVILSLSPQAPELVFTEPAPAPESAAVELSVSPSEQGAFFAVEAVEPSLPVALEAPSSTVAVAVEPAAVQAPVQPIEERGDAMLFEIDALGNMPFDTSITMPFD